MMSPVPEEEKHKPTQETGNEIEDTEYPDVVINADSSDSEGEDGDGEEGYMGYQALAQDIGGVDTDEEEQESGSGGEGESTSPSQVSGPGIELPGGLEQGGLYQDIPNTSQLPNYMKVPEMPRPDKSEILWNQPRDTDMRLDKGQADKIKSLMSGIQLPSSNIPDWAKTLSDDQWQAQVVNRLVNSETSPKQEVNDISKQEVGHTSNNQKESTCDTGT